MKNKYYWVGSIISIVLILDQLTKYVVEKKIQLFEIIRVIPGFFNLTHVRNKGAAFGILSNAPDMWRSLFFVSVTIVAVIVLAALLRTASQRLPVIGFSLIAGGAIGNLIDRLRYNEVVDFIQWYVRSYYWPSFNIADSAISIGVALLAVDMLSNKPEIGENDKS